MTFLKLIALGIGKTKVIIQWLFCFGAGESSSVNCYSVLLLLSVQLMLTIFLAHPVRKAKEHRKSCPKLCLQETISLGSLRCWWNPECSFCLIKCQSKVLATLRWPDLCASVMKYISGGGRENKNNFFFFLYYQTIVSLHVFDKSIQQAPFHLFSIPFYSWHSVMFLRS